MATLSFPCSSPKAKLGGLASRIKLTEDIRASRMVQESCVLTSLSSKYLYCPNCGTRLSEIILREAQFCPYCGTAFVDLLPASNLMPAQNGAALSSTSEALAAASPTQVIVDVQGSSSLGRTILTGFAWLLLLGWIPVIGPLIAGYKTGSLAGKATRGSTPGSSNNNGSLRRNDYQELVFSFLQSKAGMLLLRALIESIFA